MRRLIGRLTYWLMVATPESWRTRQVPGQPHESYRYETAWMRLLWRVALWSQR